MVDFLGDSPPPPQGHLITPGSVYSECSEFRKALVHLASILFQFTGERVEEERSRPARLSLYV